MHYGVKGMKWGVIRRERDALKKSEYKRLYEEYGVDNKRKAAISYGEKHKLDLDDGGGGSRKAGRKYLDMWDKIKKLDDKALQDAKSSASKILTSKYGKQTIDELDKRDARIEKGKNTVIMSAMLAFPIATVVGLIAKG